MRSLSILQSLLVAGAVLVIVICVSYPAPSFPLGLETFGCLLSFLVLVSVLLLSRKFQKRLSEHPSRKAITSGLFIGLLWTVEIGINNILHPGLPLRDIIDDTMWGIIACVILFLSIQSAVHTNSIASGIRSGFLSGLASGCVACVTALLLACFGMPLLLSDPLNIKEWTDIKQTSHYPGMAVYFAYQTLAGAMLHLLVLGVIMGLLLGLAGGAIGRLVNAFRKKLTQRSRDV